MDSKKTKLAIGFITYEDSTAKYLPYFLLSLAKAVAGTQGTKFPARLAEANGEAQVGNLVPGDVNILALDNSQKEENENRKYIKKHYSEISLEWVGENLGFARGYNRLIKKAVSLGAEYFLMLNPDMVLEPNSISKLVKAMDSDKSLGSAGPKILRWDFAKNKKTQTIDSCGIILKPGLRFINLGEGQEDNDQLNEAKILGPAGTAAIFRIKALQSASLSRKERSGGGLGWGPFDEHFFMYKEDCDLAYRLFLSGWRSGLASQAVMYHDRTGAGAGESGLKIVLNRRKKSKQVKIWSFYGQHILFIKYWHLQSFKNKLNIIFYALKMFVFVLLFEQYLLKQYWGLLKTRKAIAPQINKSFHKSTN